jgi:3-deoxy-manno-octulosonate cytidylyltransferase (CMP-KDO synthetase)
MRFIGIIPARYASTRFPGKPLIDINGKTMIQRVYEQCKKSGFLSQVIVATDNDLIFNHVLSFGGHVIMTSSAHQSGTDRCLEAANKMPEPLSKEDVVINIQGDEPFIDPVQIDLLASCFTDSQTGLATLIKEVTVTEDLFNVNKPKVILNQNKEAIYFSRSPLPYLRGVEESQWLNHFKYYNHIGIYAYRMDVLDKITALSPSSLEMAESLEQLRWIENGFKIKTQITDIESISIDTPEDLKKIKKE